MSFNETEGPIDTFWVSGQNTYAGVATDGDDKVFADLGHDWAVGGTGRDSLWGGWGDDYLNADDILTTAAGLNTSADTNPSYEDLAYGGAGRDVIFLNTNGDRGIDWSGEFNTYLAPYSQYGAVSVSRLLRPTVPEYLYAISKSEGADQTLALPGSDPARNGEPFGELGLVLQQDAAWGSQTGGPRDPQAGNISGGNVDIKNNPGTTGTHPIYQTAYESAPSTGSMATPLTAAELTPIVVAAKARWTEALGADDPRLAMLGNVSVELGNLPPDRLGVTLGNLVLIDEDAAGNGWFVDATPMDSEEFGADMVAPESSPRSTAWTSLPRSRTNWATPWASEVSILGNVMAEKLVLGTHCWILRRSPCVIRCCPRLWPGSRACRLPVVDRLDAFAPERRTAPWWTTTLCWARSPGCCRSNRRRVSRFGPG